MSQLRKTESMRSCCNEYVFQILAGQSSRAETCFDPLHGPQVWRINLVAAR